MNNELTGVQRSLSALEVQVSNLTKSNDRVVQALDKLAAIEAHNATRDKKLDDHEKRIRSLEVNAWRVAGALALVAVAGQPVAKAFGVL